MVERVPMFDQPKEAMKRLRRVTRLPAVLAVTALATLAVAAVALADGLNFIAEDNDGLVTNNSQTKSLGNVAPGQVVEADAVFTATCTGNNHLASGQQVVATYNAAGSTKPAGGSISATNASFTRNNRVDSNPAAWPNSGTGCPSGAQLTARGISDIQLTAPTTAGSYTFKVKYSTTLSPNTGSPDFVAAFNKPPGSPDPLTFAPPTTTTAPTSSASATNADNSAYSFGDWTNQNVTVTLSGQDNTGGSGLKEIRYTTDGSDPTASHGSVYASPFTISTEGATTVKWRAIDNAANLQAVQSGTVKIDTTAPVISDLGPTAAPDGDDGWYKSNVINQFKAEDLLSGLSAPCDATFDQTGDVKNVTISSEGSAQKGASGSCFDNAGNEAGSIDSAAFKIDKTAPLVSVTGVSNGAQYTLGSVPTAGCNTTDPTPGSGVRENATLGTSGGPVGSVTATCSGAKDNAGHAGSAAVTYTVIYGFSGFYQPVDMGGVFNRVKAGSAIPVKFSLDGTPQPGSNTPGHGGANPVITKAASVTIACPSSAAYDQIETPADAANSGVTYDPAADQWIYVWKTTTGLATKCQRLEITLADDTTKTAHFHFTK
jgi:hypothetical protein